MKLKTAQLFLIVVVGCALCGCAGGKSRASQDLSRTSATDSNRVVECHNGLVVSVSAAASEAGLSILKRGGNATDAAVATAFALAVTYPPGGNIGGGGFMLVHPAPGQGAPTVFDYRECAPAAAQPNMYTREESQYSHRAVAVPGTIRGLALARERFGSLPWAELVHPAIALARDGFIIDVNLAKSLNKTLEEAPEKEEFQRAFGKPGGGLWEAGDRLRQPDLARTLELIEGLGPEAFYTGDLAQEIAAEIARGNGLLTAQDLATYRPVERKPLTTRYHGYDVYVPPPPSSGGTCLLEELNLLETFNIKAWDRWSPVTLHVMAEVMRRGSYDAARSLGDPAFVKNSAALTTHAYARRLAQTIDLHKATPSAEPSATHDSEGQDTTHFSIIDSNGMAVANTYTLERLWGSRVVVKNRGFLLNNQMRAFNLFPDVHPGDETNATAPYTIANTIAPGKRPLSSMSPMILARNGQVKLISGSPGSHGIPNTLLCLLINVLDFDMPLPAAVESPRLSHQWLPDEIEFENPERHADLVKALSRMGHTVMPHHPIPFQGDAHSIWVAGPHDYIGVADRRRSDQSAAMGY